MATINRDSTCVYCESQCIECTERQAYRNRVKVPFGVLYDVVRRKHLDSESIQRIMDLEIEMSRDMLLNDVNKALDETDRFMLGQFLK